MFEEYQELVSLSRLALTARKDDVQLFIRRLSRRLRKAKPTVADQLDALLVSEGGDDSLLRGNGTAASPIDLDSRLELVRPEFPVVLDVEPIWAESVARRLEQVVSERGSEAALLKKGLRPTRSLLLTGAPGVGKSLAARWLASRLSRPLLTLDLAAVMSSYLGRTGVNVKQVLAHAKRSNCVLLLDEFDAVAKRRDDHGEIGELKRLVTVLLQEIDEWPSTGLLVAATNHPDLLDPAIWRRFEVVIEFPMPTREQTREAVANLIPTQDQIPQGTLDIVAAALEGFSFSDIARDMLRARRDAVITGESLEAALKRVVHDSISSLPVKRRKQVALRLSSLGLSAYDVKEWTAVHRTTLRTALKNNSQ